MKLWSMTYRHNGRLENALTMAISADEAKRNVEVHHYKRGAPAPEWDADWAPTEQMPGFVQASV